MEVDHWSRDVDHSVKHKYHIWTMMTNLFLNRPRDRVWSKITPLNVSLFTWRVINNKITTKDNMKKWWIISDLRRSTVDAGKMRTFNIYSWSELYSFRILRCVLYRLDIFYVHWTTLVIMPFNSMDHVLLVRRLANVFNLFDW